MKISRLASALTLSLLTVTSSYAAKYRVVELPLRDKGVNSFSQAINQVGDVATVVQTPLNPPIDLELIDFENDALRNSLTDPNGAAVGNINAEDRLTLYNYIRSDQTTHFSQELADYLSYLSNGQESELLRGFDVIDADLEGLTKSTNNQVKSINNARAVVGVSSAPYQKVVYRNENGVNLTYLAREHMDRGYLQINNRIFDVSPIEDFIGGVSAANDINNSFEVAGFSSVEVSEAFELAIEACEDEDQRADVPYESCIRSLVKIYEDSVNGNAASIRRPIDTTFRRRAVIWEFTPSGDLLDYRELGTLVENDDQDTRFLSSNALAINDNGIAVGESNSFYQGRSATVVDMAAVFDGDETIGFIDDQQYSRSRAVDINNNDVVVGYAFKTINGGYRSKFFVHDYRGETTLFPNDYFESSSSLAHGINDNGLVVGEGEVETNLSGQRRKEAFIYDIHSQEFTNINDMLSCDSPYTIIQAKDINENDEIAATAIVYRERANITGELDLDERGNTIFANMAVAVKLVPIPGGAIDECKLVEEVVKRKGGAPFGLLGLVVLGLFTRVFRR